MPKITLYIDDATKALIGQAAAASGMTKSRWVAQIIQKYAVHAWPKGMAESAGRFSDFPLQGIERTAGKENRLVDAPRISF